MVAFVIKVAIPIIVELVFVPVIFETVHVPSTLDFLEDRERNGSFSPFLQDSIRGKTKLKTTR